MTDTALPVFILNGTIGSGKSTIGLAVHDVLEEREVPHAFLDLDSLTYCWPKRDRFNQRIVLDALSELWPLYECAGARRLVLARVLEDLSDLQAYKSVLGNCVFSTVRLLASEETRKRRIESREFGESLTWHLARTTELEQILSRATTDELEVRNENRTPTDTASEILGRIGWIKTDSQGEAVESGPLVLLQGVVHQPAACRLFLFASRPHRIHLILPPAIQRLVYTRRFSYAPPPQPKERWLPLRLGFGLGRMLHHSGSKFTC